MRAVFFLAAVLIMFSLLAPAEAQTPKNETLQLPGVDPSLACDLEPSTAHINGMHGVAVKCPIGTIRGFNDAELGTWDARKPSLNNGNLSAGNREHPGYIVVAPDVGKGLIVGNGERHPKRLLLVRNARWGRTEFRVRVHFTRGLTACDSRGCVDVLRRLRRLELVGRGRSR
jgi:hypothetical protein